jgi:hypothetical protein
VLGISAANIGGKRPQECEVDGTETSSSICAVKSSDSATRELMLVNECYEMSLTNDEYVFMRQLK